MTKLCCTLSALTAPNKAPYRQDKKHCGLTVTCIWKLIVSGHTLHNISSCFLTINHTMESLWLIQFIYSVATLTRRSAVICLHVFLLLIVFSKFVPIVCISGKVLSCYANKWSSLITSFLYLGRFQHSHSFRSVGLLTMLRNLNSVHVSSLFCSPEFFLTVPFVYYQSLNSAKCLHVFCLPFYSLQILRPCLAQGLSF
jgi:hypothetical protein